MNKIIASIILLAVFASSAFSMDCGQLKLNLKKENIFKPIDVGCFVISTGILLYAFEIATYHVDPPPPSQDGTIHKSSEPSEKEKITWGIIGIVAGISISVEIPTFIHSIKKSRRIKEEINNECNKQ